MVNIHLLRTGDISCLFIQIVPVAAWSGSRIVLSLYIVPNKDWHWTDTKKGLMKDSLTLLNQLKSFIVVAGEEKEYVRN